MDRSSERLFDISSPIVDSVGYTLADASFYKPKEFQASWKRRGDRIELKISDYLIDAPDEVIGSFVRTVIRTVSKKDPRYEKEYLDWVTSDSFINEKRKIYLRRSRNLTLSSEGNERDLITSLDRLLDDGILEPNDIDNSFFSWTNMPNIRKVGFCSPMMRVVGISSILDDVNVPEFVLDYVVYHESLHLAQGYRPGVRAHDTTFRKKERAFPRYEEAERYLRSLKK